MTGRLTTILLRMNRLRTSRPRRGLARKAPVPPAVPAVLALLAVLALPAACSRAPAVQEAKPAASRPASGYPVKVENCGRTLTFDRSPGRVVTGYQPALETLLALGLQDRIAGRTAFTENGPDGFLPGHKPLYEKIPQISDSILLPQKEVMLAQGADFVLDNTMTGFDASGGFATVEELDAAGTPVYIMGGWCGPEETLDFTIEDTYEDLRNLGAIFGVPGRADRLIAELRAGLADVRRRVGARTPTRVLATDGGKGPVNAYGGAGLMNQMITLAGGENVLAGIHADYTEVGVEKIATSDPDALLVLDYAVYAGERAPSARAKAADVLAIARTGAAARNRRFLPVPAAAAHPGYRNILAIADIARFLHPEAFTR